MESPLTTKFEAVLFGALIDPAFSRAMGRDRLTQVQAWLLAASLAAMFAEFTADEISELRADYRAAHPNQDWPDD